MESPDLIEKECERGRDDSAAGRRETPTSGPFWRPAAGRRGCAVVPALASTKPVPEPRSESPAHDQRLCQAAQVHVLAGLRPRLQALDVLEVHDGGAMDAHELEVG